MIGWVEIAQLRARSRLLDEISQHADPLNRFHDKSAGDMATLLSRQHVHATTAVLLLQRAERAEKLLGTK